MYYYIYDIFVSQKKYEKQLQQIEATLIDLSITGKKYKLNLLKNLKDIINEALANEVKNIIAVGNDQTVSKIANLVVDKDIALGIIPIGDSNIMARALGINSLIEACKIVSARKIEQIDVGRVNDQYFLFSVESPSKDIVFEFANYNINPLKNNKFTGLYNINIDQQRDFKSNPQDGIMEAVFCPKKPFWWSKLVGTRNKSSQQKSIFPIKNVIIKHTKKPVSLLVDRQRVMKTPLEIEVLKKRLKIIVRKRTFD
ncbi:MAG: diacylglycerol kinase family protein [Candidatus Kuenenbacteria bacterium]